jgi:hypothetical protein
VEVYFGKVVPDANPSAAERVAFRENSHRDRRFCRRALLGLRQEGERDVARSAHQAQLELEHSAAYSRRSACAQSCFFKARLRVCRRPLAEMHP